MGSGAGQALGTSVGVRESLIRDIHRELGLGGAAPRASHRRALRTFPLPVLPLLTKGTLVWAQAASWWSVQPSQPSRLPLKVAGESEKPKAAFSLLSSLSLLASSIKSQSLLSTEKKKAQRESCVLFYLGQIEDYSPGDRLSASSEKLLPRGRRKVRMYVILVKGVHAVQSSTNFYRRLLLVTRSRRHHL